MNKFFYFTLFISPIAFIFFLFFSLLTSDVELMAIGIKGWLAILGLLLFNLLFLASYFYYKKNINIDKAIDSKKLVEQDSDTENNT